MSAAECAVCGGSRIEEVYVGRGCVIEYECGACATASTTPETGTEKVATVIEGESSRDTPTSRSQTGEPEPVALHDLADVFERPFTDPDDPRLRCAKVLTHAEAAAILEHRGDLVAALSLPPEAQARVDDLHARLMAVRDMAQGDILGPLEVQNLRSLTALLSPSTPKPARVEIDDAMVERAVKAIRPLHEQRLIYQSTQEIARAALTAALTPSDGAA